MLNFQKRFAPDVKSGVKRQTIRKRRKNPIKPGDMLYLYTGARTKACEKLGEVKCKSVFPIEMRKCGINGYFPERTEVIAKGDGFKGWAEMRDWFEEVHGLPFDGDLILW